MRRTFQFQLKPTSKQAALLTLMLSDQCDVYNWGLEVRKKLWEEEQKTVTSYDLMSMLTEMKATEKWSRLSRWSAGASQETLSRLGRAFDAFFRRVKSGESPGYPRFRGKGWFDTVRLDPRKGGVIWNSQYTGRNVPSNRGLRKSKSTVTLYIQGVGHVKVNQHRPIQGTVTTIDVSRRTRGRWVVSVACKDIEPELLAPTGQEVGVDLGVTEFLSTSDGELVANPRFMKTQSGKVAQTQQSISRKQMGSKRRQKVKARLGRLKEKERNQRRDFHRKVAKDLVDQYDVIYVEDLNIKEMLEKEGQFGKSQKKGLNRGIGDSGWSQFISYLSNKAESAGRQVKLVNPSYTSQTCRYCKSASPDNRNGTKFLCANCGYSGHADILAAMNILDRGQGLTSPDGHLYPVKSVLSKEQAEAVAFRRPE